MRAKETSLLSAIVTSACCLPALILLTLSLGSISLGATLAKFHWYFLTIGSILLAIAYYQFFKEKKETKACGCEMKYKKLTVASLTFSTLIVGAFALNSFLPLLRGQLSNPELAVLESTNEPVAVSTISVDGMTCFSCEWHLQKVICSLDGVKTCNASVSNKDVLVKYNPDQVTSTQIVEVIHTKTGYKAYMEGSESL